MIQMAQAILGGALVLGSLAPAREVAPGRPRIAIAAACIAAAHPTLVYAATHVQVVALATTLLVMELGSRLGSDHRSHLVYQRHIEGCSQSDRFGEYGDSHAADAMQRFVPPVVLRNLQPWNGLGPMDDLGCFLVECHPRYEVVHTLINRQRGVQIRGLVAAALAERSDGSRRSYQRNQQTRK
jgi:hypothetical protein